MSYVRSSNPARSSRPLLRTRRIAHVGLIALGAVSLADAAEASASLSYSAVGSVTLDSTTHHYWNQSVGDHDKLLSYAGYQYTAFWGSDDRLVLSRRKLSDNTFQLLKLPDVIGDTDDPHYQISLGVSPADGRLHISYGHHGSPHHYRRSTANFISTPPATLSETQLPIISRQAVETDITYPQYFNDASGNLYFAYRNGFSKAGDLHMNQYDSAAGVWSHVGVITHGKSGTFPSAPGSYSGPDGVSTNRNAYPSNLVFDKNNRLHMLWTWRENVPGEQSGEHDLNYAYSDDLGVRWRNNEGTLVANLSAPDDPIRVADSTVVVSVPQQHDIHKPFLVLDSHNQPHVAFGRAVSPVNWAGNSNYHWMHAWRNSSGRWMTQWLTDTASWTGIWNQGAGSLLLDGGDNAYFVHAVDRLGWHSEEDDEYEIRNFGFRTGGFVAGTKDRAFGQISTWYISLPNIQTFPLIKIGLKNASTATRASFEYITDTDRAWNAAKKKPFAITPNDTTHREYTVDMSTTAGWAGTLKYLALNPMDTVGSSGSFSIDYIRITDQLGNVLKSWNFDDGFRLEAIESNAADNYQTVQRYDLATGATQALWDEGYVYDWRRFAETRILSIPSVEQSSTDGTIAYSTREFTLTNTPVARAWEFASDKEEWLFSNQVSGFTSSNGTLGGAIVGPSAEIFTSGNLGVPIGPASNQKVRIRLKNTSAATQAKFYWLRDDDLTWTTSKSKVFAINANSDWTEYLVDLSSVPGWRGVMHTFNLYPALGVSSGSFSVDYIHIEP